MVHETDDSSGLNPEGLRMYQAALKGDPVPELYY